MTRIGQVIDNVYKDANGATAYNGKVKVRVFPEMKDLKDSDLPWASPIYTSHDGITFDGSGSSIGIVPEKDSMIVVSVDTTWTTFLYDGKVPEDTSRYGYSDGKSGIMDTLTGTSGIPDLDSTTSDYPNPMFKKFNDGAIMFRNTSNGELGYYVPNGTSGYAYFLMKADGSFYYAKRTSKDDPSPISITLDTGNKKIEMKGIETIWFGDHDDYMTLFTPLKEILEQLLVHIHVSPHGQTTPAMDSSLKPLSTLKPKLNDMKSKIVKGS